MRKKNLKTAIELKNGTIWVFIGGLSGVHLVGGCEGIREKYLPFQKNDLPRL